MTGTKDSDVRQAPSGKPKLLFRLATAIITMGLLFFFYRWIRTNINLTTLGHQFAQIPHGSIAIAVAVNISSLALYGYRMSLLLDSGYVPAVNLVNIGYALNAILPARLGDAAKIYFARAHFGMPVAKLVVAAFVEKLLDILALALLGLMVLAFATNCLLNLTNMIFPAAVIVASVAVIIAIRFLVKASDGKTGRHRYLQHLINAYHVGRNLPVARAALVTLVIWTITIVQVKLAFGGFIPGIAFGFADAMGLLVIIALSIAIPSTPAGIGVFEAGVLVYLTRFFAVRPETALAAAVVFHLVITVPQMVYCLAVAAQALVKRITRPTIRRQ